MRGPLVVLLALAACESPSAPREFVGHLGETAMWSAGEARLTSPLLATLSVLPRARIGTDTLVVHRVDDSTMAIQLPDGNGPRTITVEHQGFTPFIAEVTLHGFRTSEIGPVLSGYLELVPQTTRVLGASNGLAEVDVRTGGILRHWDESVHSADCVSSVGASVRTDHYVLWGKDSTGVSCAHPSVWHYGATSFDRVDSVVAAPGTWGMAEIGPHGIISGGDDALWISQCDSAGCTVQSYFNQGGGLSGVSIAPAANRAFLHHYFGYIVDATTGDTIGRLPVGPGGIPATAPFYHVENLAFDAAADTAFVVANGGATGSKLLVVTTASGALIDTLLLPNTYAVDVRLDQDRDWLYVALLAGTTAGDMRPELRILDRNTLQVVATLRAPAAENLSITAWHQFRLVPDPALHAIYLVATIQVVGVDGPSKILRYDLLP